MPDELATGFSGGFGGDATEQLQWTKQLKKSQFDPLDLSDVAACLREEFLKLDVLRCRDLKLRNPIGRDL